MYRLNGISWLCTAARNILDRPTACVLFTIDSWSSLTLQTQMHDWCAVVSFCYASTEVVLNIKLSHRRYEHTAIAQFEDSSIPSLVQFISVFDASDSNHADRHESVRPIRFWHISCSTRPFIVGQFSFETGRARDECNIHGRERTE